MFRSGSMTICFHMMLRKVCSQMCYCQISESRNVNSFSHTHTAPTLPTLFTSKRLPSETNVECYRVSQLLTILSNLSFKEPCAHHFSRHDALLRFLLLCVNNVIPEVQSLSLDLLTNLAPHILLPSHLHSSPLTELLMASVHFCILSNDKLSILRGMCL